MEPDVVEDDEGLYRSVKNEDENFPFDQSTGERRISAGCFSDRAFRPSVDRACLRDFNPSLSQVSESDGLLKIYAYHVRRITIPKMDSKGSAIAGKEFAADVEPVPLEQNAAHAEIYARPAFDAQSIFRRFCDRLKREAQWEIMPAKLR